MTELITFDASAKVDGHFHKRTLLQKVSYHFFPPPLQNYCFMPNIFVCSKFFQLQKVCHVFDICFSFIYIQR